MKVIFLSSFEKDIDKLAEKAIKQKVANVILQLENVNSLKDISAVKKMKGATNAYRIKINDYRLGFFFENNIIELARLKHRKDIYKFFP
jgi:mRNA interferase RelE/StbE